MNTTTSEVWKPFRAPNLARFYGLLLQQILLVVGEFRKTRISFKISTFSNLKRIIHIFDEKQDKIVAFR